MILLWSTTISSIGGIILGLLVLIKTKKQIDNISFSLVSIIISLVVAANYLSLTRNNNPEQTLLWIRIVMFLVPYLMLSIFYLCTSYLNSKFVFNKKSFTLLLIFTIIVSIVNLTPLSYTSVTISQEGNIIPITGMGMPLNAFQILPLFGYAVYAMIKNINQNKNQKERNMIKFLLYLFLASFGTQIITSFVIVAIFHYTTLVPLGNFFTFLFIILMTVSIFSFKLFRIKIIGTVLFAIILSILAFAEIITASDLQTIIYKIIVFLAVSFIGYELIESVIREIKQKEQLQDLTMQLGKANGHLKELDKMKTEFVSLASHELLTPVSAIEGYLSMMLDEHLAKVEDPTAKRYLVRIYKSS